ncbi:MAG: bifunctional hydroxymethylpyrimidine kinase/phosphomethylpyrimidine kinase, partial [Bacteroidia bacterium]|nr:bifunctional hydroxymethylpyrimidine kinase/phosphomethylpyrimidine kinase [Bacteroidia bacterium]
NLSDKCAYLVKGGHGSGNFSEDLLFEKGKLVKIYTAKRIPDGEKHGSGCVLSSAITANLAKGVNLKTAISNAKIYIGKFLKSNPTLNGYHF